MVLLALIVAGCGDDSDTTTTGVPAEDTPSVPKASRQLVVHESEFKLDPAQANGGKVAHALDVDGPNGLVELDGRLEPGESATLEADLDKPGTYAMYCPLDGHRGKGMQGTITVGGSSPARGAEPTTTTTSPGTNTTPTQTTTQTQTQTETKTVTTPSTSTQTGTSTTPTATTGSPSPGGY
jgi:plastocyanin